MNPDRNYCEQPRMAIGYSFASYLKIFLAIGLLDNVERIEHELVKTVEVLERKAQSKAFHQWAFTFAEKFQGSFLDVVGSSFLIENAELMAKQVNWNSKSPANFSYIPEAMHYLSEGVENSNLNICRKIIFLTSNLFSSEDKKLVEILNEYFNLMSIRTERVDVEAHSKIEAALVMLLLSSYISCYLGLINERNPSPTPGINFYKKKMI